MIYPRQSELYPPTRLTPPGSLIPFSADDDASRMDDTIETLWAEIQRMQSTARAGVISAERSNYTNSIVHLSPGMPWILGFGTELVTTINRWDEPDFDRAASIITLVAMIITLAHVVFIYHRYHRQIGTIQHRTQRSNQLQEIQDTLAYLKEANRTAQSFLRPELQANLPFLYKTFNRYVKYMQSRSAGSIPYELAGPWQQVKEILHSAPDDPRRAQIADLVQGQIFPLINHYIQCLQNRLTALGYTPQIHLPATPHQEEMPEVVIEN